MRLRRLCSAGVAVAISVLGLALPAGATHDSSGLAAWWRFDDGAGTTAADSSGHALTGTLTPSVSGGSLPQWDSTRMAPMDGNSGSLLFSGSGFVNVPDTTNGPLDANSPGASDDQVTLAAWIYLEPGATFPAAIIRKGHSSDREYGMDVQSVSGSPRLRGFVNTTTSGGGTADIDNGTAALPTGTWVHVAVMYNGSNVQGYINGSPDGPASNGSGDIFDNNLSVRMGGQRASDSGGAIGFEGNIDEVRVYNRAIGAAELASISGDTDDDGVLDVNDADDDDDGQSDADETSCGSNPKDAASMSADTDADGSLDCLDSDDDNDGQTDADETSCGSNPADASSKSPDNDNDASPDCVDSDDDNDGHPDSSDAFDFDPNEWADNDGDDTGDNADTDDDDGQSDADETACGSDPKSSSSKSADQDGDGIPDCTDPDDNGDGIADTAPPTTTAQCKKGGWKTFNNPAFKNEGDCVSYVATKNRNQPNG